jgi:hypothetical protein
MSTKAEVIAAIEAVDQTVHAAASVASELVEGTASTEDITFLETTDGRLVVSSASYTDMKWTYVSNTPPNYPWYGPLKQERMPVSIAPVYANNGDFVKVLYGPDYSKSADGPRKDTVPPVVTSGTPHEFIKRMTVNVNIERLRPLTMSYQGAKLTTPPYYQYLAGLGISAVRFFIPYRKDLDMGLGTGVPSVESWDGLLDAAQSANGAGLQVFMGCTDVVGEGEIAFDDWNQHADNVAKRVAERGFDPKMFALEVANELAGNDNPFWNKMRTDVHDTIRKRLPNHIIVHGCAGWNGINEWNTTWTPPADKNIILQFHDYVARTTEDWAKVEVSLTDFARIHGVPIISGEQGIDFGRAGPEHQQAWMDNLWNMSQGAGVLRPCPWTVTDGNGFRLNRSAADPTLTTLVEQSIPYFINFVKAVPGWGV